MTIQSIEYDTETNFERNEKLKYQTGRPYPVSTQKMFTYLWIWVLGFPAYVSVCSHCRKQNAKRCVSVTIAWQNCVLEYGVSLSFKCELKRTRGSPRGWEDSHKRKRSQTQVLKFALFFAKSNWQIRSSRAHILSAHYQRTAHCEAPERPQNENMSLP